MKENNELIAKFMGIKLHDGMAVFDPTFNEPPEELQYHTSWDWLMPVIHKISDLWEPLSPITNRVEYISSMPISSHIQQVHKEVVDFIEWYTTKQQEQKQRHEDRDGAAIPL